MDTGALTLILGKNLIAIVAAFLLREKWPHKYSIGLLLCLFAPAWGQIYVESKYNWVPWLIFITLGNAAAKASSGNSLIPWLVIGGVSSLVMYFRILATKTTPTTNFDPIEDKDKNYVAELNKKLEEAGVETERDLYQ